MEILLLLGLLILGFYVLGNKSRLNTQKQETLNRVSDYIRKNNQSYSYRLNIVFQPHWPNIYKEIYNNLSEGPEKDREAWGELSTAEKSASLFQRKYFFTEYYDSSSGLKTRIQRTRFSGGRTSTITVDDFGDTGRVFDVDRVWNLGSWERRQKKEDDEDEFSKLTCSITENAIYYDVVDKVQGGVNYLSTLEGENLFRVPLNEIVQILFVLHKLGLDEHTVISWPDKINKTLNNAGVDYEAYFEYGDFEKLDLKSNYPNLHKALPGLEVSKEKFGGDSNFKNKYNFYSIELEVFEPNDLNKRISDDILEFTSQYST